ncbi:MAG: carbonic anhydrase [Candidatus Kuenenia sp.]|nr:carbonic anhydrase [Candidatus Kuenenia hertensis]
MKRRHIFQDILILNEKFVESSDGVEFAKYKDHQQPYITMLTCADSRIQGQMFGMDIINKVFTIRNAGNQFAMNKGSIAYAITTLNTPLLLIIGHTNCGAVKFAAGACLAKIRKLPETEETPDAEPVNNLKKKHRGIQLTIPKGESLSISKLKEVDFSAVSREVQREMLPLTIPIERGIGQLPKIHDELKELAYLSQINVDYQVEKALEYYGDRVKEDALTVIGGIYDFVGAYSDVLGRIIVTNINGIYDKNKLKECAMAFYETDDTLDKSGEVYNLCCKLIDEKVNRI